MTAKRLDDGLPADIESLLAMERAPLAEGEELRRRALVRARGTMPPAPTSFWTHPGSVTFGLALAATVGIAGAMAWHSGRSHEATLPPSVSMTTMPPAAPPSGLASNALPSDPVTAPTQAAEDPSIRGERPVAHRVPSAPRAVDLELTILQPAQAAIARGNPAAALVAIDEHERRFRNGQLAEEREALRVQALAAMGRKDEARRMAAEFSARFPHSVLLSRIDRGLRVSP